MRAKRVAQHTNGSRIHSTAAGRAACSTGRSGAGAPQRHHTRAERQCRTSRATYVGQLLEGLGLDCHIWRLYFFPDVREARLDVGPVIALGAADALHHILKRLLEHLARVVAPTAGGVTSSRVGKGVRVGGREQRGGVCLWVVE